MNTNVCLPLLGLTAALLCPTGVHADDRIVANKTNSPEGIVCRVLTLSPTNRFQSGEAIPVQIVASNAGTSVVYLFVRRPSVTSVSVIQANGKPAKTTSYGSRVMSKFSPSSMVVLPIKPAESYTNIITLSQSFEMLALGEYSVTAHLSVRNESSTNKLHSLTTEPLKVFVDSEQMQNHNPNGPSTIPTE